MGKGLTRPECVPFALPLLSLVFPACSQMPWQGHGRATGMAQSGPETLFLIPLDQDTVVPCSLSFV